MVSLDNLEVAFSHSLVVSKDGLWSTFQGEGPRLGQRTLFLRLSGCNLACSWCDTPYTWDWTGKNGVAYKAAHESEKLTIIEVTRRLNEQPVGSDVITITGGEPLLQQQGLNILFETLVMTNPTGRPRFREVNFETNGTILPDWTFTARAVTESFHYVVSPKLENSGNAILKAGPEALLVLQSFAESGEADFKFVCCTASDLAEVKTIVDEACIPPQRVWIMPEGIRPGQVNSLAQDLAQAVLNLGWNLTTRFHLQLWGNTRAR